ncbi:uncharacterized protein LOC116448187 [Corvus moneduloides]|uniref:uncharacterized protein LOC116448187 n=1 Tax=Corvus moneduloides TaxID=1196302 RepID=UPI0013630389|nr:uncharacterized protein LOC116448187 [Corvus moneduloides]
MPAEVPVLDVPGPLGSVRLIADPIPVSGSSAASEGAMLQVPRVPWAMCSNEAAPKSSHEPGVSMAARSEHTAQRALQHSPLDSCSSRLFGGLAHVLRSRPCRGRAKPWPGEETQAWASSPVRQGQRRLGEGGSGGNTYAGWTSSGRNEPFPQEWGWQNFLRFCKTLCGGAGAPGAPRAVPVSRAGSARSAARARRGRARAVLPLCPGETSRCVQTRTCTYKNIHKTRPGEESPARTCDVPGAMGYPVLCLVWTGAGPLDSAA